jgi:hypothetical protein
MPFGTAYVKTQAHSIRMPYGDLSFMGNVIDEVNGIEQ